MNVGWYLEVEGGKTGPFTTDQVEGLLREGEVLTTHRIAIAQLGYEGPLEWMTISDWKQRDFQPPPRPEIVAAGDAAPPESERAARGLFDAWIAAKEARLHPPETGEWSEGPKPSRFESIQAALWGLARKIQGRLKRRP